MYINPLFVSTTKYLIPDNAFKKMSILLNNILTFVATHTYNPSPWKADRVATWEVQRTATLQNKFLSQSKLANTQSRNPQTKMSATSLDVNVLNISVKGR